MARHEQVLPGGLRFTDLVSLGALAEHVPLSTIREVVTAEGRSEKRVRLLPADVTALYVVAMWLFRDVSYEEVLNCLLAGLRWAGLALESVATKGAITQARVRLGWQAMRTLYLRLARPLATSETRGAWYRSWLTVAIDGSTFDVPDTEANAAEFGYPGTARGSSAYPQIRCLALSETGTHAVFACQMDSIKRGETTLAKDLLAALKPGMLLLADRAFFGYELWTAAAATKADLLWRVKKNIRLPVKERLADGSFLSEIHRSGNDIRDGRAGLAVRVVEYTVGGGKEVFRLITTILDPRKAPALELAALYPQRWEIEAAFDEIKTHIKGSKITMRSKTPELVRQEFWGLMIAHWALRDIIHAAALRQNLDPDGISFVHAVRLVRRMMPRTADFSP
jgi:hypothetical protein